MVTQNIILKKKLKKSNLGALVVHRIEEKFDRVAKNSGSQFQE
jgi:hypothetical protein